MTQIYTPINNNPTALEVVGKPIWERLFQTVIPYRDTVSADFVRLFGMPTVGDPVLDKVMQEELVTQYLTIDNMVTHFKNGITVRLVTLSDSKIIYELISAYLRHWQEKIRFGVNVGGAPIDDLILLDRFAAVVFPYAAQHFTQEFISSNLVQGVTGGGKWLTRDTIFKPQENPDEKPPEPYKHRSMAEVFIQSIKGKPKGRYDD